MYQNKMTTINDAERIAFVKILISKYGELLADEACVRVHSSEFEYFKAGIAFGCASTTSIPEWVLSSNRLPTSIDSDDAGDCFAWNDSSGRACIAHWSIFIYASHLTHWMPKPKSILPKPPVHEK